MTKRASASFFWALLSCMAGVVMLSVGGTAHLAGANSLSAEALNADPAAGIGGNTIWEAADGGELRTRGGGLGTAARMTADGLVVGSDETGWKLGLALAGYGREGRLLESFPLPPGRAESAPSWTGASWSSGGSTMRAAWSTASPSTGVPKAKVPWCSRSSCRET